MTRNQRLQSTRQKRAATYLRVSSEEQVEGYSLSAQERAIAAYCNQHGYEIVAQYRDDGKSARSDDLSKRPDFARMLSDAEAGRFDVVICHKNDRFARNRRVAFYAFHRLGSAGVGFISIAENMDYSTPAGQLMLTMLVGLGQFYSDNLTFETKKGKAERKAQGLYNGLLPFGATKGSNGLPVLDREVRYCDVATHSEIVPADGLLLAFGLAASGKSDREIARSLSDAGYRTSGNRGMNPWTKDSVRPMLQNRFYVGDLPDGAGGWVPGKHGVLIDPAIFERAQTARAANTCRPRWVESRREPWALPGVAVCGGCGANVNVLSHSTGRRRIRCSGRTQGNGCEESSCYADIIDEQIGDVLAGFAVPEIEQERLLAAWRHYHVKDASVPAERAKVQRRIARLKNLYLDGDISRSEYQAERVVLADKLAAMPSELDGSGDEVAERLAAFLADVASAWQVATQTERNVLSRQLFAEVIIHNKEAVAVVPRPDLRPFFFALPRVESVNSDGKECTGGSDGERLREVDVTFAPLVPLLYPEGIFHEGNRTRTGRYSTTTGRLRIPHDRWAEVAARARIEGLRQVARDLGVSHETIRTIANRVGAQGWQSEDK
jgi:DNA invertase Pin-like site-specific DNA recombinase